MSILFGHPGGNPNSHHAALSHWEHGRLEAFCTPWMPTPQQLSLMSRLPIVRKFVSRLSQRSFGPLLSAPRIEGRLGELWRMTQRAVLPHVDQERLSNEANIWLMNTLSANSARQSVKAVHSYEDCSLTAFETARRQNKTCIYDMPIGYYAAWQCRYDELKAQFADWIGQESEEPKPRVSPEQKRREMELADLVLAPSHFVANTIKQFVDKPVAIARYGVDTEFWTPAANSKPRDLSTLRIVYAGHISIRKGIPLLMDAWRKAALPDARLELVGSWRLAESRKSSLPAGVEYLGHRSAADLREELLQADLFVFPSYFEGLPLIVYEALACGTPVLVGDASPASEELSDSFGRIFATGDVDALVEALRYFNEHRDLLLTMRADARRAAESFTWQRYRQQVSDAVETLGL